METIFKTAGVNYSAQQMYALVNDIERYPAFIPYCTKGQISHIDTHEMTASLTFAFLSFEKSFTTRNTLKPNEKIEICLEHGPFKHLHGLWIFEQRQHQCFITLDFRFELDGHLLNQAFNPIFKQISEQLIDTFIRRAHEVYGP